MSFLQSSHCAGATKAPPHNLRDHSAHAGQMRQANFRPCADMADDIRRRETAEPPGFVESIFPRHAEQEARRIEIAGTSRIHHLLTGSGAMIDGLAFRNDHGALLAARQHGKRRIFADSRQPRRNSWSRRATGSRSRWRTRWRCPSGSVEELVAVPLDAEGIRERQRHASARALLAIVERLAERLLRLG